MSPDFERIGKAVSFPSASSRRQALICIRPWLALRLSESAARTGSSRRVRPSRRASSGRTKNFATKKAATGWPGSPIRGLLPALPRIVGLPGLTAMPCSSSSPSSPMMRQAASFTPALLPPERITASQLCAAAAVFSLSSASSSTTIPKSTGSAPKSLSSAASIGLLTSRTCPGPGFCPAGISSSPVEITPTRRRGRTAISVIPTAASAPISCGASTRPALRTVLPGNTSSPRKIRFIPGAPGLRMPTVPSP